MTRIRTLLLTGANNHDWERSAPYFKKLLEDSGRFEVTLTTDPSAAMAEANSLRGVQLIFVDYNGPMWSNAAQTNFVQAIESGTGLVILHAADNAFKGWVEYERMCGLCWREGTGHGHFHTFRVNITDRDHPIVHGVEDFDIMDELYHKLVHMHQTPYEVLATAFSSKEQGGTDMIEPVMITTRYGKGRVFHQILGHLWKGDPNGEYKGASLIALKNPGFVATLLRGCEWAATGNVM